jgi:SprT-like family
MKVEDSDQLSRTEEECQELFATFNQQFFGRQLPAYRVLRSDRFGMGTHGECRKKQREIHLGTALGGLELEPTLLHEMAHAGTNMFHGKRLLAEMLRLADLGAPTREDWKDYQDPKSRMGSRQIAGHFYNAGVESDQPWKVTRAWLGRLYGLTDDRGRSESRAAVRQMLRFQARFFKGRRFRNASKFGQRNTLSRNRWSIPMKSE